MLSEVQKVCSTSPCVRQVAYCHDRNSPVDTYKKLLGFYTRNQDVFVNYSLVLDATILFEVKGYGDLNEEWCVSFFSSCGMSHDLYVTGSCIWIYSSIFAKSVCAALYMHKKGCHHCHAPLHWSDEETVMISEELHNHIILWAFWATERCERDYHAYQLLWENSVQHPCLVLVELITMHAPTAALASSILVC